MLCFHLLVLLLVGCFAAKKKKKNTPLLSGYQSIGSFIPNYCNQHFKVSLGKTLFLIMSCDAAPFVWKYA